MSGVIVAPLIVPVLIARFDWPSAFYITGAMGLVWVVLWASLYWPPVKIHVSAKPNVNTSKAIRPIRRHMFLGPLCSSTDRSGQSSSGWGSVRRSGGSIYTGRPGFFHDKLGIDLKNLGWPLVTVYLLADAGSIGGGWLSSRLLKKGWSVNAVAEDDAACLRAMCGAGLSRGDHSESLGCRLPDRHRGGRTPRFLGERLYAGVRHGAAESGKLDRRAWRTRGGFCRDGVFRS